MKKLFLVYLILVSLNVNAQWVQMSSGMGTNKYAYSLFSKDSVIFAGIAGNPPGLYRSTNLGVSWSPSTTTLIDVYCFAYISNVLYAGTETGIYKSTDNGLIWTSNSLANSKVWSICSNGSSIFVGTDSGVFRSTNNGNNWLQSLNSLSFNALYAINNIIFAGTGKSIPGENTGIYISTNDGGSWSQTSLNNQTVRCIISNNYGIFAGTTNSTSSFGVFVSTNNGINWTQTSLNNKNIYSLCSIGSNVIAGAESGGVYHSSDNGGTWLAINEGMSGSIDAYGLLIKDNYVFLARWASSIWRRPLSQITLIKNISTLNILEYSLQQNFPNPFNPSTNIKFAIPKSSDVRIAVYDISGKELELLVNEQLQAGTYQVDWNGSKFSSGVYFYKIQSEGYTETKRMMLLK